MTGERIVLALERVCKTYGTERNPVPVLRGIDLEVRQGEYAAIVGPSGSGKSTLLNILGCLDRPTSGSYSIDGTDVSKADDRALSRIRNLNIGFVFQSFHLISHLTVLENVEMPLFYARMPRKDRRKRCEEYIATVGLSHRASHVPSELSGGECQRAAIARALSNDPSLLLADEPTGNLDTTNSTAIMKVFRDLHEMGRTIVMITHDLNVATAAPRRISIRDGLIEADAVENGSAAAS